MQVLAITASRMSLCTSEHATSNLRSHSIHRHQLTGSSAAAAAMTLLRTGGTAVDAVEMAIKIFEDCEITNAGYGSNLAIDGTVEGDAVLVDHLGRSGGVGAVAREMMLTCIHYPDDLLIE